MKRPFGASTLPIDAVNELTFKMTITHVGLNYEICGYANSSEHYLENLQANLFKFYSNSSNKKLLQSYESGHSCICESISRKGLFYRAHIIEQSSLKVNLVIVQSVDYGFNECISKTNLYEVDLIYFKKPAINLRFKSDVDLIHKLRGLNFETLKGELINKEFHIELLELKKKNSNDIQFIIKDLYDKNLSNEFLSMAHIDIKNSVIIKKFHVPKNSEFEYYRIEVISIDGYNSVRNLKNL